MCSDVRPWNHYLDCMFYRRNYTCCHRLKCNATRPHAQPFKTKYPFRIQTYWYESDRSASTCPRGILKPLGHSANAWIPQRTPVCHYT